MEKTYDDDEIEIDLLELLGEFRRKIWIILGVIVLFGGVAGAFSKFVLTPQYKSTAMVYILSKETTLTSLADLQIGSQLTKDYKIIVTSRRVLNQVIDDMKLNLTYKELLEKVTIDNPQDTRILSISVEDPAPDMAKLIADKIATVSSDYIGDIMEMVPPKLIEEGEIPIQKSSPSNVKNAAGRGDSMRLNHGPGCDERYNPYRRRRYQIPGTVRTGIRANQGGRKAGGQGSHDILQIQNQDSAR